MDWIARDAHYERMEAYFKQNYDIVNGYLVPHPIEPYNGDQVNPIPRPIPTQPRQSATQPAKPERKSPVIGVNL
jgi:hypothetical protein